MPGAQVLPVPRRRLVLQTAPSSEAVALGPSSRTPHSPLRTRSTHSAHSTKYPDGSLIGSLRACPIARARRIRQPPALPARSRPPVRRVELDRRAARAAADRHIANEQADRRLAFVRVRQPHPGRERQRLQHSRRHARPDRARPRQILPRARSDRTRESPELDRGVLDQPTRAPSGACASTAGRARAAHPEHAIEIDARRPRPCTGSN